jgi:hypothetical protein
VNHPRPYGLWSPAEGREFWDLGPPLGVGAQAFELNFEQGASVTVAPLTIGADQWENTRPGGMR